MEKFEEWLCKLSQDEKTGPVLYHYTDSGGLLGIISNATLRLGDIRYMNDPSERIFGVQVAHAALAGYPGGLASDVREALETALQNLATEAELDLIPFAFSLTRSPDDLGQWRSYCGDGQGFCIGFKVSAIWRPTSSILGLFRIRYFEDKQIALFHEFYRVMAGLHAEAKPDEHKRASLAKLWVLGLLLLTSVVKNKSYMSEKEWRLIELVKVGHSSQIEFAARRRMLRPFIVRAFAELASGATATPVEEVILGPSLDPSVASAVRMLFTRRGLPIPRMRASEVPLRIL
ncbi:MAG TPA: DUF2971 domain-containing protein [Allosphingosinicella sp.]|jgi:hypothetical protein|nr:DUF2971 domain-containing protein [Allosphingosinicella sp.]